MNLPATGSDPVSALLVELGVTIKSAPGPHQDSIDPCGLVQIAQSFGIPAIVVGVLGRGRDFDPPSLRQPGRFEACAHLLRFGPAFARQVALRGIIVEYDRAHVDALLGGGMVDEPNLPRRHQCRAGTRPRAQAALPR